jgi:hypothetical protein
MGERNRGDIVGWVDVVCVVSIGWIDIVGWDPAAD